MLRIAALLIAALAAGAPLAQSSTSGAFPIAVNPASLVIEQEIGGAGTSRKMTVTNVGAATYDVAFSISPSTWCTTVPTASCLDRQAQEYATFKVRTSCRALAPGASCDVWLRSRALTAPGDVVRAILHVSMGEVEASASLAAAPLPRQRVAGTVSAVQYVRDYAGRRSYFVTVLNEEKGYLDTGRVFGWQRTGDAFWVYPAESTEPETSPVCRLYGRFEGNRDSHFYSASPEECARVRFNFPASTLESDAVFRVGLPDAAGACAAGTSPVYRLYNALVDVNHFYTTSVELMTALRAAGWVATGSAPHGVAMCVPQ